MTKMSRLSAKMQTVLLVTFVVLVLVGIYHATAIRDSRATHESMALFDPASSLSKSRTEMLMSAGIADAMGGAVNAHALAMPSDDEMNCIAGEGRICPPQNTAEALESYAQTPDADAEVPYSVRRHSCINTLLASRARGASGTQAGVIRVHDHMYVLQRTCMALSPQPQIAAGAAQTRLVIDDKALATYIALARPIWVTCPGAPIYSVKGGISWNSKTMNKLELIIDRSTAFARRSMTTDRLDAATASWFMLRPARALAKTEEKARCVSLFFSGPTARWTPIYNETPSIVYMRVTVQNKRLVVRQGTSDVLISPEIPDTGAHAIVTWIGTSIIACVLSKDLVWIEESRGRWGYVTEYEPYAMQLAKIAPPFAAAQRAGCTSWCVPHFPEVAALLGVL